MVVVAFDLGRDNSNGASAAISRCDGDWNGLERIAVAAKP